MASTEGKIDPKKGVKEYAEDSKLKDEPKGDAGYDEKASISAGVRREYEEAMRVSYGRANGDGMDDKSGIDATKGAK